MEIFSKSKPKCKRARIYVRVSDVGDRGETLVSPEIQIHHCETWAKQNDVELPFEPVIDLDKSGDKFEKRQIAKMIDEVARGLYDTIIVWKWSRWGRNLKASMINMALLDEVKGTLIAATEPVDVTTPTGVFARTQFLSMAQLQLDQIREGWRDAHRMRLSKGLPHDGGSRFGYVYQKGPVKPEERYQPHPEQFPLLREMYLMYLAGKSHRAIAVNLNERGFFGNRGAAWSQSTVRATLDKGFGAGRIYYSDYEAISDKWDHAISAEEWLAYQERRNDVSAALPPRVAGQRTMFKGLVYCQCGRRMSLLRTRYRKTYKGKVTDYHYALWKCIGKFDLSCKGNQVRDGVLREATKVWFTRYVEGVDTAPDLLERKLRADRALADVEEIQKQIRHFEGLKKNGVGLVIRGVLTEEEFAEQKAEYEAEISRLNESRRQAQAEADVNVLPPTDIFQGFLLGMDAGLDEDALNAGLKKVIGRINIPVGGYGMSRVSFTPRWEVPLQVVSEAV